MLQITSQAVTELARTIHPFLFKFHAMWDRQHRGNLFRVFTTRQFSANKERESPLLN